MIAFSKTNGRLTKIQTDEYSINFRTDRGIGFYVGDCDVPMYETADGLCGEYGGIGFKLSYLKAERGAIIRSVVKNISEKDITAERIGLRTGIDCYMEGCPDWNDKFFPTLLRCEKTHMWGYFENPRGERFAIASACPAASYHLEYNRHGQDFGHRIYTADVDFFASGKLPERHPHGQDTLLCGEEYVFDLRIIPLHKGESAAKAIHEVCGLPMISAEKYTLDSGETPRLTLLANGSSVMWETPCGEKSTEVSALSESGVYTLTLTDGSGKSAQAKFFCRRPWMDYLRYARHEALLKPQKASTHCESWYGFFSGFLAARHCPNAAEDNAINSYFDEVFPLIWDEEKKFPKTAPNRIQNMSALVSVLVDRYEAKNDIKDLVRASEIGDFIMSRQTPDGAYRNREIHYTCVIYVAKSMLELAEAEEKSGDEYLEKQAKLHYASAKRAVDELVKNLECIGTEGEHTLEDGMISCSALQIAGFALTLKPDERRPYTEAAEHMIDIHSCLEQNIIPDCRMNGGSLRFWEGQYDVMVLANFMNSPHGWSAWSAYAKYYLYLLTGKEKYLSGLLNLMGACIQLMDSDGNLRWAFAGDPQVKGKVMIADIEKPVNDGYESNVCTEPAYRGKYEQRTFGEEYIDMISGWYRPGTQKVMGGYETCPLICEDNSCILVDNQGGACDNDVHEIFKCMEETVLKKAFLHECADGHYIVSSCRIKDGTAVLTEESDTLYYCIEHDVIFKTPCGETVLKSTDGEVKELILNFEKSEKR